MDEAAPHEGVGRKAFTTVSMLNDSRRLHAEIIRLLFEHLIYTTAIAILFGMIYRRLTEGSTPESSSSSAYAHDVDVIANDLLKKAGITLLIYGSPISHGDFFICPPHVASELKWSHVTP